LPADAQKQFSPDRLSRAGSIQTSIAASTDPADEVKLLDKPQPSSFQIVPGTSPLQIPLSIASDRLANRAAGAYPKQAGGFRGSF
jgi:hypothetical protein